MNKSGWYKVFLVAIFVAVWIWAAINPLYPEDWLLENYLVFIFVPIIILSGFYFRLSNLSYTLMTVFMVLHVIGSHYTYSDVPFGFTLQEWLGASRNMYDRLVHFSFGLLLAYPVREVFIRVARARGFWGYYFPFELTLGFSAIYELIEWGAAASINPSVGLAFLGAQGDIWDAQKDMLLAGIGAVIAMVVTAVVNIRYDPRFWSELKESFQISKKDTPLGEQRLEQLIKNQKKIFSGKHSLNDKNV